MQVHTTKCLWRILARTQFVSTSYEQAGNIAPNILVELGGQKVLKVLSMINAACQPQPSSFA